MNGSKSVAKTEVKAAGVSDDRLGTPRGQAVRAAVPLPDTHTLDPLLRLIIEYDGKTQLNTPAMAALVPSVHSECRQWPSPLPERAPALRCKPVLSAEEQFKRLKANHWKDED